ncbi:MAG: lipopolysaccharide kinase InaA family protein [Kiritimatiellia bacterium]|jgi:hypothetical protein
MTPPETHPALTIEQLEQAIASPDATVLQSGRNLTVRTTLALPGAEPVDVVVKRFPAPSLARALLDRLRKMPEKATRSFAAARHIHRANPGLTPEPVAVLETRSGGRPGPGWFVTRYEPGMTSFRTRLIELYNANGPCEDIMALLQTVAEACARMHDAGFMHRDLGNQNIMLATREGDASPAVLVVDLNRSRLVDGPLDIRSRARDLSRINLPSDFLRVFLEMYWRGEIPPRDFLRAERRHRRLYALHCATRNLRHPFRRRTASSEPDYPAPRDLWIWDAKSEQAISTMRSRDRHRHQSHTRVTAPLLALLALAPRYLRKRRLLRQLAFERPVVSFAERVFVSITADAWRRDRELAQLRELGCIGVHLRLYAHEPADVTDAKLDVVLKLKQAGFAVAVSIVQDRATVRDPAQWLAFCDHVVGRVHDAVVWVELLHAVNRVKWGVWSFAELRKLLATAPALKAKHPDVSFIGPSVIDFEWDYLAAALRCIPRGLRLSALSAHLYVDRRGPPEAFQGRFDALGKLQVFRAMALAAHGVEDHLVVSEFNWPLKDTREWSPVGSPYVSPGPRFNDPSVDEARAAAYTLRYIFIALCSGLADNMVFWSLAAHGFGLVDPGARPDDAWRRRPAYTALRNFFDILRHAHYTEALARGENGVWAMRFVSGEGGNIVVAWNATDAEAAPPALPFKVAKTLDLHGREIPAPAHLTGEPVYFAAATLPPTSSGR